MKRFNKKFMSMLAVVLAMVCVTSPAVYGMEAAQDPVVYYAESGSVEELAPRMTYLSSVFTDLQIVGNRADCQGNYTTFKNVKVQLTVTLQRSTDKTNWSRVTSWSQTWTGAGQKILNRSLSNISSGYYYRVQTNATVLSGTTPLETVIVNSAIRSY